MATSMVSAVLKRIGLGKLSRLDPPQPIRRYERSRAGELITSTSRSWGESSVAPATASSSATGRLFSGYGSRAGTNVAGIYT
jgi:hypothetical protein